MTYLEDYFSQIVDGRIVACEKMKRQADKLLFDLYNPGKYHFDEEIALRHINFMEKFCKTPSGAIGTPLKLELFQKARFEAIFGFVDDNNIRRYNEVLTIEGRKNGKTTECAATELDMLINDGEGSPQIYNVATQREQAALGFDAVHKMVQQSPLLNKYVRKRASDLYFAQNMGKIKTLASNTNSLDGLDTHCAIIDELAAIKNRDLYDLIKQSMGARVQPLLFEITTNGYLRGKIFDSQYDYASNVINGIIKDEHLLAFIYELDNPEEWDKEDCWIKANPGLHTIKRVDYVEQMVAKAKADSTFKPTVLTKDFNIPQTETSAWLTYEDIVNVEEVSMDYLAHSYAIAGVDLSATTDLSCASLLIKKPNDPKIYVLQKYFLPEKRVEAVELSGTKEAPYRVWAEKGWLNINEGSLVDYNCVTEWFNEMVSKYDIRPLWVCYDRALAGYWAEQMDDCGYDLEKIAQGPFTWSQPMKEMGAAFTDKLVVYNNNPMLKWCLMNTASKALNKDGIETIQPVKIQQQRRIDGTVSLLNAWVGYVRHYEEFISILR